MEIVVKGPSGFPGSIWDHFLLKTTDATVQAVDKNNQTTSNKMTKLGGVFRWDMVDGLGKTDNFVSIDLVLTTTLIFNGRKYPLLKIFQRFSVSGADFQPTSWFKMSPDQEKGFPKAAPPLHPLLAVNGGTVTVNLEFLDVTKFFNDIHGDTPWFRALELLKGTARTIRVLAALRGHPFIWYVIVPDAVQAIQELQPNLLFLPADYGGIPYVDNKIEGITTPNHDTSLESFQCGGEILFSFLTNPIADSDYEDKLERYLQLTKRFEKRAGDSLPPLHHFREVLAYYPSGGTLRPGFWDIPFGFEQALTDRKQILVIPQLNGGQGGIAILAGLKALVQNAVWLIYSQGNTLTYDTLLPVKQLILTCYSESGGNAFTASSKNLADIRALICFEAQYMNQALKKENKNLTLGKQVIPLLLKQSSKVAILGRHKQGWESKYMPQQVDPSGLILLPDEANYGLLEYPPRAYDSTSLILKRRYSRLLKNAGDPIINKMLTQETGVIDYASAISEAKVDEIIGKFRKMGFTDEKLIKTVFTANFNVDDHGGFFTHNIAISSGQELPDETKPVFRYFNQVLSIIG